MAVFDIVFHYKSILNIGDLFLPLAPATHLKSVFANDKVRYLGRKDIVVYPHLIVEESLTSIPYISKISG